MCYGTYLRLKLDRKMVGKSSWKSGARAKWDRGEIYVCTCPASPTRPTQQCYCNASSLEVVRAMRRWCIYIVVVEKRERESVKEIESWSGDSLKIHLS
jgi:hypothetical protein